MESYQIKILIYFLHFWQIDDPPKENKIRMFGVNSERTTLSLISDKGINRITNSEFEALLNGRPLPPQGKNYEDHKQRARYTDWRLPGPCTENKREEHRMNGQELPMKTPIVHVIFFFSNHESENWKWCGWKIN